mmetsp:Transcript_7353/g.16060  ORF Transcript_7353/g.16060 Transcript_7353/m.16060 type:complete len:591 (+) Transcript_7353:168-1940(+)
MSQQPTNTLRVWHGGQSQWTAASAQTAFAGFGDLLRLDLSARRAPAGSVVAVFADIRSAEKALKFFGSMAEIVEPLPEDTRSIAVSSAVMQQLSEQMDLNPKSFGEVERINFTNHHGQAKMIVTYYNIHATWKALEGIPGSEPHVEGNAQEQLRSHHGRVSSQEHRDSCDGESSTTASSGGDGRYASTSDPAAAIWAKQILAKLHGADRRKEIPEPLAASSSSAAHILDYSPDLGPGVPPNPLASFEIVPSLIRAGKDKRTTVIVRKIPRSCSRQTFLQFLDRCGLQGKYTMVYTFQQSSSYQYAVVDLANNQAVLRLYECLQHDYWYRQRMGIPGVRAFEMIYSEVQGVMALREHFGGSKAISHPDPNQRVQFFTLEPQYVELSQTSVADVATSSSSAKAQQERADNFLTRAAPPDFSLGYTQATNSKEFWEAQEDQRIQNETETTVRSALKWLEEGGEDDEPEEEPCGFPGSDSLSAEHGYHGPQGVEGWLKHGSSHWSPGDYGADACWDPSAASSSAAAAAAVGGEEWQWPSWMEGAYLDGTDQACMGEEGNPWANGGQGWVGCDEAWPSSTDDTWCVDECGGPVPR